MAKSRLFLQQVPAWKRAGGPHSLYVNPTDFTALAKAVSSVLADQNLADRMKEEGLSYAQGEIPPH